MLLKITSTINKAPTAFCKYFLSVALRVFNKLSLALDCRETDMGIKSWS